MSLGLLWVEVLLTCVLFAAVLIIAGLRRKTRIATFTLCALGMFLPVIFLGWWIAIAALMRYASGIHGERFLWAIILLVFYLIGAGVVRRKGARRDSEGIRRAFFWPLGRVVTWWVVVVALMGMTLWNMSLQTRMEVQALRAEAGAIALSVIPPEVSDSVNAAPLYEEADERFKAATTAADKDVDYGELDAGCVEVKGYLQRQQKTLEILRRAAEMPECRLDYDYMNPDMEKSINGLGAFRRRANLLGVAAKAEARAGNVDLALADCGSMYGVGRHADSNALMVSGMVFLTIDKSAGRMVAKVLPFVRNEEELNHFSVPDPREISRAFVRVLHGEEAFGLASFCDLAMGTNARGNLAAAKSGGTFLWLLWLRDDVVIYRDYMRRMRRIAEQPYYQTSVERKQLDDDFRPGKGHGLMAAMIAPSFEWVLKSATEAEAMRSVVGVACAATRYRLDHGEYPATADMLVPKYLESVPVDPFDGKPLRFKKRDDGSVVIYSIGRDGIDSQGEVEVKKGWPGDVGVVLQAASH